MKRQNKLEDKHPKLHKWLLKAEKRYVALLPALTVCAAAVHIIAEMPTVQPIWHRCDADPLLLSRTPKPMDYCEVCHKAIIAPKRVLKQNKKPICI